MKMRTGFVSNSSSSSFVLAISKLKTKSELLTRIDAALEERKETYIVYGFVNDIMDEWSAWKSGELEGYSQMLDWVPEMVLDNWDVHCGEFYDDSPFPESFNELSEIDGLKLAYGE